MASPVPEAAVEAMAKMSVERYGGRLDNALAEAADLLSAALDTGSLIAVPEDDLEKRERQRDARHAIHEAAAALGQTLPDNVADQYALASLQALGLLPEQEQG